MGRPRHHGELRTRNGCQKCRKRRVKCPKQRPVCCHCERLGFVCLYETRLRWETPSLSETPSLPCFGVVTDWMFLNGDAADFEAEPQTGHVGFDASDAWSASSISPRSPLTLPTPTRLSVDSALQQHSNQTRQRVQQPAGPEFSISLYLPPFRLSHAESYLWSYFDQCMTPQCVLNPTCNPYRDVVLRIAAATHHGPLFYCVLSAAANQLYSIGLLTYKPTLWLHLARALRLLRAHMASQACLVHAPNDQVIVSALMLCFLDIAQDCSKSWTFHADFARNVLCHQPHKTTSLSAERQGLYQFALTYFVSHDILASTAGSPMGTPAISAELCLSLDSSTVFSLTGFSKELLVSLSNINHLASLVNRTDGPRPSEIDKRRRDIEMRLHQLGIDLSHEDSPDTAGLLVISEVKRLAALMYLYGRIDDSGPYELHMIRLTSQILKLLPTISLRTNTILWPLFVVAVLGIKPENDDDRMLLLTRLAALQETRQLGNTKRAREIIEAVWITRDLRHAYSAKGWSVLDGRNKPISLA